ncbi:MAG: multidrug effflux MFS transporter [Mycetocola sp.]
MTSLTTPRRGTGSRSRANRPVLLVLGLLAALGPFTVDLYLPALPVIQASLDASTAATQFTLTATTLGFALGQLVIGNWTDAAGRRLPLLLATSVHVVASIGIVVSPSIEWVLAFRFLQGLGAAGSSVVASAIVRDLFSGVSFVKTLARLALISGLAPVVAPFIGSQLLELMDWRGLFGFVATYGAVVVVVAVFWLSETLPSERRLTLAPRAVAERYRGLLGDRVFVGVALIGGLMVSGVFSILTSSSFLLQETYGLDARGYSMVFALNAISFVMGTQACARVIRRVRPAMPLTVSLPLMVASGFAIAPASRQGVVGISIATVVFMLGAGATAPCLGVIGVGRNAHQAGTAAALLGATNFGMAGLVSPLVGAIGVDSAVPMGLVIGATEAIGVVLLWALVRPRTVQLE